VLGSRREGADALQEALHEAFAPYTLPAAIAEVALRRGIAVLARR
jgi:hypothetical protein